ncbi:MAG: hypothetical protein PHH54_03860 [Candidatus Nanoarchaeia archaeon]|nr:hypothetical protein [Candidatus Nanoarchaeia archaeon]MDD5741095.1 hypothetical protein [Candidatus Nanoarchaeia archaeon]
MNKKVLYFTVLFILFVLIFYGFNFIRPNIVRLLSENKIDCGNIDYNEACYNIKEGQNIYRDVLPLNIPVTIVYTLVTLICLFLLFFLMIKVYYKFAIEGTNKSKKIRT